MQAIRPNCCPLKGWGQARSADSNDSNREANAEHDQPLTDYPTKSCAGEDRSPPQQTIETQNGNLEMMTRKEWELVPITNKIAVTMELLRLQAHQVAIGMRRSVIVFGGAGCGKSHNIDEGMIPFRKRNLEPVYGNPSGYNALLKAFKESWEDADDNPALARPIIFDEADTIFNSEKCLNILKVAMSTNRRLRIYNGQMLDSPLFISANKDLDSFPDKKRAHFEAVFDRCQPLMVERTPFSSWQYAVFLALTTAMLRTTPAGIHIKLDVKVRALEWFTDMAPFLKTIGPRALCSAAEIMTHRMEARLEEIELSQMLNREPRSGNVSGGQHDWRELITNPLRPVKDSIPVPAKPLVLVEPTKEMA